ncbi:damage-inducible protein DinB [Flavobacterium rivuli WB 3.3-2 = DSM 21788]|uniref:Damage-inducible protein DinB n=1 Tax=Flavobacterium rivuli WB 3.3-2 = DSM 21788 TaxID=1121895 RepID=A0A0A2LYZ7_9FLAO|nr:DinB family protein [Flavobacterium rivuli]KGO85214.1 damage-inducible protein DinB [Flavobacterium rivuli WB 3.3-2 = DSM 21788]
MKVTDLQPNEYAAYYSTYLQLVSDECSLTEELEVSVHNFIRFVQDIPMDKYDYRYAEGKWTIKDIIQHLIDTERIFSYRALRFARNDKTELPGFDETQYGLVANGSERKLQEMLTELALVRQSTIMLFKSFSKDDLLKTGIASGNSASVRALGFIIIGHQNHHIKVFKERYL